MKTIYKKLLLALVLSPLWVFSQNLTGVVKDASTGELLPGVNVIVRGTTNGTSTDLDGAFSLSNIKSGDVIEFSYLGYETYSLNYTNQRNVTISLQEDAATLEGVTVVAVGYGTVRKQDATGALDLLKSEDFNKGAVVSGSDLLNGKIAGVTINTGGGSPGAIGQIRIRGGSSLDANNDPLVIVDGLPMKDVGVLNRINPNDIESFSVLKDASATAIYGVRAANGVILITTKKGGRALQVDYNFQYGSGRNFNQIDVMNAGQFRQAFTDVLAAGSFPSLTNDFNDATNQSAYLDNLLGTANTNWQDAIMRRTDFVDHNLSVRGTLFNAIPTRLTLGNTYQEGLLLTDYQNRNTINVAMNPTLFNGHLRLNANFNYAQTGRRNAPNVLGAAMRMIPTAPIYDPNSAFDGFFEFMSNPSDINSFNVRGIANPVAQLLQTNNRSQNQKLFGNFEVDYKFHFLPELRWVTNLGYDKDWGGYTSFTPNNVRTGVINGVFRGNRAFGDGETVNKLLDSYFIYTNNKNEDFTYDVTLGYSYQRFEENSFNSGNIADPANTTNPRFFNEPLVYIGYFARTNFNYQDKYLLTLTMRRDGTSRFGANERWGNFPAASFAWKLKNEFFQNTDFVSDLKLRAGWGINGQQDIGGFTSSLIYLPLNLSGLANSSYMFGSQFITPSLPQGFNPLIRWEETNTFNVGLDFGFANNRLTGSLDAYLKKSNDLLQRAPFPDGSNFSNEGPQNIGSMTTKGIELTLNYDAIKSENFNWNVNLNATSFQRTIDQLAQDFVLTGSNIGSFGQGQVHISGFAPNTFWLFKQVYDSNGRPVEGSFADLNGDNIITDADRYLFRNPDPKLVLGFTSNMNYKNFDLSFNLRASIGNRVFNAVQALNSSYFRIWDGYPVNLNQAVYNTGFFNLIDNQNFSDMFVEDASFLRMDFATLGYTFTNWLDGKASVRLFTGVQNPFVWTKYSGLDPELTGGIDNVIYPRQRQYLFGCNINF